MGSKSAPQQQAYTGGVTRIGGREVASNKMVGW